MQFLPQISLPLRIPDTPTSHPIFLTACVTLLPQNFTGRKFRDFREWAFDSQK